MSTQKMKDSENVGDSNPQIMKMSYKLNNNVRNSSSAKDIAVENVIRKLRQKKNIEVKNVNDVDSKLKRIIPIPESTRKSEVSDRSKSLIINLDCETDNTSVTVQKIPFKCEEASVPSEFLEIEDDDIEDYLEIDQNVVEDLEALIPEEEIVSISNSLIQPENDISVELVEDSTSIPENKTGNTGTLVESSSESILISDSDKCEDRVLEDKSKESIEVEEIETDIIEIKEIPTEIIEVKENETEIKEDEEIENEVGIQLDNLPSSNYTKHESEIEPSSKDTDETITINNDETISEIVDDEVPEKSPDTTPVVSSKRKSEEKNPEPKKRKTSPKINKCQPKKRETRRTNKFKEDTMKNLRKITDFFVPTSVKPEISKEEELGIENKIPEETSQNEVNKPVEIVPPEIIGLEETEPTQRSLRSRSKILKEPETKELQSTHVNEILETDEKEKLSKVPIHTTNIPKGKDLKSTQKDKSIEKNIEEQIEVLENDRSENECIGLANVSNVDKNTSPDVISLLSADDAEAKLPDNTIIKNNNCKRQPKRGCKKTNAKTTKVSNKPKEAKSTSEDVSVAEILAVNTVENVNKSITSQKEEVSIPEKYNESKDKYNKRDSNENNLFSSSLTDEEEVNAKDTLSETLQITEKEQQESGSINEESTTIVSTESSSKQEQIVAIESTQVKKATKKRNTIRRKKALPNIETNDTTNLVKSIQIDNSPKIQNNPTEAIENNQSKKGKNKPQKRTRKKDTESKTSDGPVSSQVVTLPQKNPATKLEIYDFDESTEAVEIIEKIVKKRKYKQTTTREITTAISPERNITPSKRQIKSENNNTSSVKRGTIESYMRSSSALSEDRDRTIRMDSNNSIPNGVFLKMSPEVEKEMAQFGQDWKQQGYGPYKRIDRCNVCLMYFRSYNKLRDHRKVHEVENPYKCWHCEDCFQDVEKLAAHLRIHKGKMPYPCKKCDATFWTAFQLERHQLVHVLKKVPPPSRPPSKVFKCEECGKEFKKICDLERHTRVHTGEKPSVCNICNKRFQQLYNLNKHLYTHTQEKNFECVICQKKFGRNDVLNRHVLTHSIVKPFKCSLCSRTFIRNTQLKLHLRKHHGLDKDPGSQIIDDPGIESVDDTGNGSLDGNESVDDPIAGTSTEV